MNDWVLRRRDIQEKKTRGYTSGEDEGMKGRDGGRDMEGQKWAKMG